MVCPFVPFRPYLVSKDWKFHTLKSKISRIEVELQEEKNLRENTEKAFGKTVDKLIDRIKNLEQEIDISLREPKNSLFPLGF